jgi:rod shape determining protein RodA
MTAGDRKLNRKFLTDFDWWLFLVALSLTAFGILEIYSAQPTQSYWSKQITWVGLGLLAMITSAVVDYRRVAEAVWYIYGAAIALLALVPIFGQEINGQRAWLSVGGMTLQPSEFAKIATILALAVYLAKVREQKKNRKSQDLTMREVVTGTLIVLFPVGLIALQPDYGTAITFFSILAGMVFVGGLRPRFIVVSLLVAIAAFSLGWKLRSHLLKPYQLQRIEVVLHPEKADPRGYGYQTMQSNIAVGSGGVFGRGIMKGTQSRLKFLPYPHTDFIASVVAEETGLVGMLGVLVLYWFILMRSMGHAERSRDQLGLMLITGIVCLLGFHVVINIGMVVGLLPIMGIPLPLMSYGGSSILATFLGLGLVASVRFHRHVN